MFNKAAKEEAIKICESCSHAASCERFISTRNIPCDKFDDVHAYIGNLTVSPGPLAGVYLQKAIRRMF